MKDQLDPSLFYRRPMTKLEIHDTTTARTQKNCPQCNRTNETAARICVCGFWFVEQAELTQVSALRRLKSQTRSRNVKKASALVAFVAIFFGVVVYFGGFIDLADRPNDKPEAPAEVNTSVEAPASGPARAFPKNTFEARVTGIISGDKITVIDKYKQEYTIWLSGIDAPETNQFFAEEAKNNLSALVLDKTVLVITQKIEDDGSVIGKVLIGGQNASLEQVRAGFAVHTQSAESALTEEDRILYANAEQLAKKGGFGIWSSTTPGMASPLPAGPEARHSDQILTLRGENITPQPPATVPTTEETAVVESQNVPPESPVLSRPVAVEPAPTVETISNQTPLATSPVENQQKGPPIARCSDGSLYYGPTRRGACSGHGGVADWLGGANALPKADTASRKYTLGPRGGCYYVNSKGSKSYVDKSLCN